MCHGDMISFTKYENIYQEHNFLMHLLMYSNYVECVDMIVGIMIHVLYLMATHL